LFNLALPNLNYCLLYFACKCPSFCYTRSKISHAKYVVRVNKDSRLKQNLKLDMSFYKALVTDEENIIAGIK